MPALMKFSKRQYIEEFAKGKLFMRTLGEFARDFEGDELRCDDHEGVTNLRQAAGAVLSPFHDGQWLDGLTIAGAIRYCAPKALNVNVFCMYTLYPTLEANVIDPRNLEFGDTFALVTDTDKFLDRINAAQLPPANRLEWNLVSYIDEETHNGGMGPFVKRRRFEYQREFRIAMMPGLGRWHTLDIGDISDIVEIRDSACRIRFVSNDAPTDAGIDYIEPRAE